MLNIGQTEDIQLSLYNRGFCVTIRVALALVNFTMRPKDVTIF